MKKTFVVTVSIVATSLLAIGCSIDSKKEVSSNKVNNPTQVMNTEDKAKITTKEIGDISETTYTLNDIIIKYPQLKNISDTSKKDSINKIIKDDALSIINFYDPDKEDPTLEVNYEIKLINDNILSIVYYGYYNNLNNAYPIEFICSTNIDLNNQSRLMLKDYADIKSISNTLLNTTDYKTKTTDKNLEKAQLDYIKQQTEEEMINILSNTDFSDGKTYPLAFSYQENGDIVVVIPLQHAIGDYVEIIISK